MEPTGGDVNGSVRQMSTTSSCDSVSFPTGIEYTDVCMWESTSNPVYMLLIIFKHGNRSVTSAFLVLYSLPTLYTV